jgi:hypothetical protein
MWSYENGRYRQYLIPERVYPAPSSALGVQSGVPTPTHTHIVTDTGHVFSGDVSMGLFVSSTGNAAINNGSITTFNHDLDASFAYPELQLATKSTSAALGVVKDSDRHLIATGFALVWLVRPIKMKLPMSGIYVHTINGIPAPDQVLVHQDEDNSFVMFRKAGDEILELRARLDALTL